MKRLIEWLNRIISKNKAMKRWKRVVTVLAAILTFATTYALILPAITVERDKAEDVGGMYLEQTADTDDMLEDNALEPLSVIIAADNENAVSFSYADDEIEATAIFSTDEEIPEGAELVVNPVIPESEEYADLSSRSAALLDKEFIYDVTTCSFYDFALVYDNVDVTPETGLVDIQITFHNNTVEHVDDMLFAGRYARPASEEGGFVVKYEGVYYSVDSDGTLTPVNSVDDPENPTTVTVGSAMVWSYDNNGTLYHHTDASDLNRGRVAADYYYKYIDISTSDDGVYEEQSYRQMTGEDVPFQKLANGDFNENGVGDNYLDHTEEHMLHTRMWICGSQEQIT